MTTASTKTAELSVERIIPAPPGEIFDAWLNSAIPGSPWHQHEKLIVDVKVDGLWYWLSSKGTPHYGRFVEIDRPGRIRLTWMSPNTLGLETIVTVSFQKKGEDTLLTLVHSGLPNDDKAKAHDKAWNSIVDRFGEIFAGGRRS